MLWLGMLLPVCYWAGYTGATIPSQWVVLSAVLPFGLWRSGRMTDLHWLMLAFVAYAAISICWSANRFDSVDGLWKVGIWALAFWMGSTLLSLRALWKGLAIGLLVSLPVMLLQIAGHSPVYFQSDSGYAAGLLFNSTMLGACTALVIVGAIEYGLWGFVAALCPILWMAHSRGAWLALAVAVICKYLHWSIATALLLGAAAFFYVRMGISDSPRLEIWGAALAALSWFGFGAGTFTEILIVHVDHLLSHPEFAHNDVLQLLFEYGIGALPWLGIMAWTLTRIESRNWPVFVCFVVLGMFWFPLFAPIPAFIGCVVAGHLSRGRDLVCDVGDVGDVGRSYGSAWDKSVRLAMGEGWPDYFSME